MILRNVFKNDVKLAVIFKYLQVSQYKTKIKLNLSN